MGEQQREKRLRDVGRSPVCGRKSERERDRVRERRGRVTESQEQTERQKVRDRQGAVGAGRTSHCS